MYDWLQRQGDYLLFLHGFALVGLSLAAIMLGRKPRPVNRWAWMAGFGLFGSLHHVAQAALSVLGPQRDLNWWGHLFSFLSYLCLLQFGWSYKRHGPWSLVRDIALLLPVIILAEFASLIGLAGLDVAVRFAVSAVAGCWAAWSLFRESCGFAERTLRLLYRGLMVALLAYTAFSLFEVPLSVSSVSDRLNEDLFLSLTKLPNDVPQCLTLWLMCALAIRLVHAVYHGREGGSHCSACLTLICGALTTLMVVAVGWALTDMADNFSSSHAKDGFLARAQTAANLIDPDTVQRLAGETRAGTPGELELRRQLTRVRLAGGECRFAYVCAMRDGRVMFLADSEPADSSDYSPFGQFYDEASADLRGALIHGMPTVEPTTDDRWGTWVSAFAPIRDAAGKSIAVLGLDVDARVWERTRKINRLLGIACAAVLSTMTILFTITLYSQGRASALAKASEQRFRMTFENAPEAIFIIEQKTGMILAANPFMSHWLDSRPEDFAHHSIERWLVPHGIGNPRPPVVVRQDQTLSITGCRYRHRDGRLLDADTNGVAISYEGRACLLVFARDVTERVQITETLREEATASVSASQAKSEFLANMSHEIRTPMNGIVGMTSLLLDTKLDAMQRDYVDTLRSSCDSLLTIINDVLDYSKIEAGKLELERLRFDLRRNVENALDLIAVNAHQKGLSIGYTVDTALPTHFYGDTVRLQQVLVNLLGNAVKFTNRGEVEVAIRSVPADRPLPPGVWNLEISVRDTGIGIPEDRRERLFQTFSQVDTSTTRKYGGSGLGLAICRRLVELMNGRIWVESHVNEGSTFYAQVMLEQADPEEQDAGEVQDVKGRRLLILSSDSTARRTLKNMAESWGVAVSEAADVPAARELLAKPNPPEIIALYHRPTLQDGARISVELKAAGIQAPILLLASATERKRLAQSASVAPERIVSYPPHARSFRKEFASILQLMPGASRPVSGAEAGKPVVRPLRILLAEDNPVNQKVALKHLEQLGYRADVVRSGVQVMDIVKRHKYDVIIMDVQMPEMDGLTATRRLRAERGPATDPWIIAMTANATAEDRTICLDAGMNDYVGKPIRPDLLAAALLRAAPGLTGADAAPIA